MSISGIGVAAVSAGALLIYAGLQDINPLEALKQIASGNPTAVDSTSHSTISPIGTAGVGNSIGEPGSGELAGLAAVAYSKYGGDKYSQTKRGQSGYSDCSSFVSKAMRSYVPGYPLMATGQFMISTDWTGVKSGNERAGDIVVNGSHMAIIGGRNSSGILIGVGQQNSRRNVQVDTIKNLMTGTGGGYMTLRYARKNLSQAPQNSGKVANV